MWRQAAHLRSKRVQLMTTALRSFLRLARYRDAIGLDLAACVRGLAYVPHVFSNRRVFLRVRAPVVGFQGQQAVGSLTP